MAAPLVLGKHQFFDSSGKPLAMGTIDVYTPGTTSRKNTYNTATESSTTQNSNPITLDASGSADIFVQGYIEAVIKDSSGNQVADTFGSAFTISTAIEPFLLSTSAYDAVNSIAQDGGNWAGEFDINGSIFASGTVSANTYMSTNSFSIADSGQLLVTNPTANETIATRTSFTVQGTTQYPENREFLASIGFTSDDGGDAQALGGITDKVALYVGFEAKKGTANGWALNTCMTIETDVEDARIFQGYELDFNNNNKDRGTSGKISDDLGGTSAMFGLSITGASKFTSTSALVTTGGTTNSDTTKAQWARSMTNAGYRTVASIHDLTDTVDALLFDGIYSGAVINTTAKYGNAGANPASGTTMPVIFMKNAHQIVWQDNTTTHLISDYVTTANERVVGGDSTGGSTTVSVYMGGKTLPLFDGLKLGNDDHPWGDFTGAGVYPQAADSYSIGRDNAEYSDCYLQNAPTIGSDPTSKNEITSLPLVKDLIANIDPIRWKWKQTDGGRAGKRTHWGFNASNVGQVFADLGLDFGGYVKKSNGKEGLRSEQLLPIVWQALKDVYVTNDALAVRIAELESKKH